MSDERANIRLNGYQVLKLRAENQPTASAPASPNPGQMYYDTTIAALRAAISGSWVSLIAEGDARLTNARTPTGPATGDLTNNYPNPTIAPGVVDSSKISTANRGPAGAGGGTAADITAALRALGMGAAGYAMPGNASLAQIVSANGVGSSFSMGGNKLTGGPSDPAQINTATDFVTKAYVDAALQGLTVKPAVRFGFNTNQNISAMVAIAGGNNGDRLVLMGQNALTENGIWIYNGSGTALTRAPDADTGAELQGAFVFVSEGPLANNGYYQTSDAVVIGTTNIVWTQFSSAGAYTASGQGITLSGNNFSLLVDSTVFNFNSGNLVIGLGGVKTGAIADGNVTTAKLANAAVDLGDASGTSKYTGTLPVSRGGTGASSNPVLARSNLGAAGIATVASPALSADTWSANITHNLGQNYPVVTIWDTTTLEVVEMDIRLVDGNNIQIRSGGAAAANAYLIRAAG